MVDVFVEFVYRPPVGSAASADEHCDVLLPARQNAPPRCQLMIC